MKLRSRLFLTTLGVAVPLWLLISLGFRELKKSALDGTLAAVARATFSERADRSAGDCSTAGELHRVIPLEQPRGAPFPRTLDKLRLDVYAYDAHGHRGPPGAPNLPETAIESAIESGQAMYSHLSGDHVMRHVLVALDGGQCPAILVLVVGPDLTPAVAPIAFLIWPVFVAVVVIMLGVGPVVLRARRLTAAVRRWQADETAGLPSDARSDELGELARAFHSVAVELLDRERNLREFIENTTHDLATPLTVLQGHLSTLSHGHDETAVWQAMNEAQFLGSLLANLGLTAKLNSGIVLESNVDICAVVSRVHDRFRGFAERRGVSFHSASPDEPVLVLGDPTFIEQAVNNLVDNALRYCDEGGHVALVFEALADQTFSLRVLDDGPGLTPDDRERLLAGNMQQGQARSRDGESWGIGLTIVDRIARLHRWQLELRPGDEGGLVVELTGRACS